MDASALQLFYTSSELTADGGSLPAKTVTADATSRSAFTWVDASGIDWTYAIGLFDEATVTPALRGTFFAIRSATATTITTTTPLSAKPVTGDVFYLSQGIRFRSNEPIPFHKVDAFIPTITSVTLRSITGVTIKRCDSAIDLFVRYDVEGDILAISIDGDAWQSSLDVTSDVVAGYLQTATGEWLVVDVDSSALPAATTDEKVMISELWGTLLPEVWLDSENEDNVLHHFSILKNVSTGDTENVAMQSTTEIGTAEVGATYTDGDASITLDNVDGLPGRDFWLYLNDSETDLRYVTKRAGNVCYLADTSTWQEVPFDNGVIAPTIGQTIEAGSIAGILRAVYQTGGTWAGSDASGTMVISSTDGLFGDGETLIQDSLSIADVDGGGVYKLRGVVRQSSWVLGEAVQWYPPYDILAVEPDSNDEFEDVENPQSILVLTTGFGVWVPGVDKYASGTLSSFGSGDIVGLVIRRFLLSDMRGSLQIMEDLSFDWE